MCVSCEGLLSVWTLVRVDLASRDCEGCVRTAEQVQGCRWPPEVVVVALSPVLLSSLGWEQMLGTRAQPALTRSEGSLLSPSELQASGLSLGWAHRRFPCRNEQNCLESVCLTSELWSGGCQCLDTSAVGFVRSFGWEHGGRHAVEKGGGGPSADPAERGHCGRDLRGAGLGPETPSLCPTCCLTLAQGHTSELPPGLKPSLPRAWLY